MKCNPWQGQSLTLSSMKHSENKIILPNIFVPMYCIKNFHERIMITTCKSDVGDIIGLRLTTLSSWVNVQWELVNLFKDWYHLRRSFLTVMESHSTHCFKCGVKMSVFLINGGFLWTPWNEISHKKFHCFTVLLTVIFINSSSGTFHQWTLELHLHDGGIYLYI